MVSDQFFKFESSSFAAQIRQEPLSLWIISELSLKFSEYIDDSNSLNFQEVQEKHFN